MINAVRGTAYGPGRLGKMLQERAARMPLILPMGREYLQHKLQFAHVDDVARVIAWILAQRKASDTVSILNLAARGEPLTISQIAQLAQAQIKRVPTVALSRGIIHTMWNLGATSIPPDAFPYLIGSYTMDTSKLRHLLGKQYEQIVQFTNESAIVDTMKGSVETRPEELKTAG
jgi:nucleoside-diphosphate-sugar epimerase